MSQQLVAMKIQELKTSIKVSDCEQLSAPRLAHRNPVIVINASKITRQPRAALLYDTLQEPVRTVLVLTLTIFARISIINSYCSFGIYHNDIKTSTKRLNSRDSHGNSLSKFSHEENLM